MKSRDRVLKTVKLQQPDQVPMYMWLTPALTEQLYNEQGVIDHETYFNMDIRFAEYHAQEEYHDYTPYTAHFHPETSVDSWGCGTYPVGYYHFTKTQCPLRYAKSVEDIQNYPFPQLIPELSVISQQVADIKADGLLACSQYECGTFEQAHALMGMEPLLAHMVSSPNMVNVLFERISDIKARIATAYVKAGVDILWIGDDIGMQSGPLMAPTLWQKQLLPHLKKIIAAARNIRPDIPVAYHSCGAIHFAVPDLIDAGVTILQSIQPEVNDPVVLKQLYGQDLAFWGGIGSQSTMSHGTPDQVRNEVQNMINSVGAGGGYICSPAHFIEPECSLMNLDAFVDAVAEFGQY